jgi:CheY-like chemotaxis protein
MPLRVLVVDDSPVMRSFIRRVLNLSGMEVEAFLEAGDDGLSALDVLGRERAEIILIDVNMPQMNGEECPENAAAREHLEAMSTGASVELHAEPSDRFEMRLEQDLMQEMAAGFLGVTDSGEIRPGQVSELACELVNMVCGVTLSRMAPEAVFKLDSPREIDGIAAYSEGNHEVVRWLDSGQGLIGLALAWTPERSEV